MHKQLHEQEKHTTEHSHNFFHTLMSSDNLQKDGNKEMFG